jgi:hypothetical protein
MIAFIGTSLQLQSIMTAHSIPYWTTSVFSSTVTNHERRIRTHSFYCLEQCLSDESLLLMNSAERSHVSSLL